MPDRPVPSYRLHRPSGRAVVTLGGKDHYLGKHGSPESRDEYDRVVGEWLAQRGAHRAMRAGDLSVGEVMVAYLAWADTYYRKDGRPTSEPTNIRASLRPLRRLYGLAPARDFGPLALKAVRQSMIDAGLCRTEVNKRVGRVVRMFKYAVENEMVPASVHHGLKAVAGLRKGRSQARESEPVRPVPDAFVDAIRPHVARQVWAMVELQRLTGMRPGEVCQMRSCDLETSGRMWAYRPESHKTEHHGRERVILIGPRAREVLEPWLRPDLMAYLFSPAEAGAERKAGMRARRRTKVQPSQKDRRKARPERTPGERYDTHAYYNAIRRGCARAFPHPTLSGISARKLTPGQRAELRSWNRRHSWHPHRLRHNAATRVRREFGLDVSRAVLGHSTPLVTAVYAEADMKKAAEAMERLG